MFVSLGHDFDCRMGDVELRLQQVVDSRHERVSLVERGREIRHVDGGDGDLTGECPAVEVLDGHDTIEGFERRPDLLRFDGALLEEDCPTLSQQNDRRPDNQTCHDDGCGRVYEIDVREPNDQHRDDNRHRRACIAQQVVERPSFVQTHLPSLQNVYRCNVDEEAASR
jgi:hypothetical protein